ncbi:MAG: AraC family transcriptional regulator, partial [Clostridiales bacterium]|nr:AraC family transcriptional regulator [Clostridiales bacterium]
EYAILLFFQAADPSACADMALEYVMEAYERLADRLGVSAVFGISRVADRATDIPALRRQSEQAVNTRFYSNGNPVILYSEIGEPSGRKGAGMAGAEDLGEPEEAFFIPDLQREIDECVFGGDGDEGGIDAFIGKYLSAGARARSEVYLKSLSYSIAHILQLTLIQRGLSFRDATGDEPAIWAKLSEFETILDLSQWLKNIITAVKEQIEGGGGGGRQAEVVGAVKEAVAARYMEPLNVSDIARCAYLGPKQANAIFRKAAGSTIFDYLMGYRMEKAKQLLKESGDKVGVVAEKVGYANKSHFSMMFRRYTGMTPYEYRSGPAQ